MNQKPAPSEGQSSEQTASLATSDDVACSAREPSLPQEWQAALNEFYRKYATNPTNTQKINTLILKLGDCSVCYMGMSRDTPEQQEAVKLRVLELDYLERVGLYKPDFC